MTHPTAFPLKHFENVGVFLWYLWLAETTAMGTYECFIRRVALPHILGGAWFQLENCYQTFPQSLKHSGGFSGCLSQLFVSILVPLLPQSCSSPFLLASFLWVTGLWMTKGCLIRKPSSIFFSLFPVPPLAHPGYLLSILKMLFFPFHLTYTHRGLHSVP